jgi:hypothetical protein
MAQDYDVSLKLLFRYSKGIIARTLFGDARVTDWLNVEQPRVKNLRSDILARCGDDGGLRNVEFESSNDPDIPRSKADYYMGFWRLLNEHVEQVVLYAGKQPLTISPVFKTPSMTYYFRILDLKTFDGEPLLASEDWGDNILALLTPVEQERVLQRVEAQIRKLDGEEQQNAASIFVILSGIMGIEETVVKRVHMIDIMENKVLGPAIRHGIEQGKTEGERGTLSRLLTRKFGPLSDDALARLQRASETELFDWIDRVLTARTLDEVFH